MKTLSSCNEAQIRKRISLIGGTFDACHRGHQEYIKTALRLSDHVYLLLSSDNYCKLLNKPYFVKPFEIRKRQIQLFLETIDSLEKVSIFKLDSLAELKLLCINSDEISTVIVSEEYLGQFYDFNESRRKLHKKPFNIILKERYRAKNGVELSSRFAFQISSKCKIQLYLFFLFNYYQTMHSKLLLTNRVPELDIKIIDLIK